MFCGLEGFRTNSCKQKTSNDAGFGGMCLMFKGCFVIPARLDQL